MSADAGPPHDDPRWSQLDVLDWLPKPIDLDRLAQILDRAVAGHTHTRPTILHVDDDADILELVGEALRATADVVSVDTIEKARRALGGSHFDLALLDISVGPASGLELLPDLRTRNGAAIPVILFSAYGAPGERDPQVQASFGKSPAALDGLVAAVQDRLMLGYVQAGKEVA